MLSLILVSCSGNYKVKNYKNEIPKWYVENSESRFKFFGKSQSDSKSLEIALRKAEALAVGDALFKIKSNYIDNELEEAFFKNSIPFSQYDNSESQLKLFFGRWRDPNRNENIFYPDFPIPKNSDSLREIYKSKLNDMTIDDSKYNYDE